MKKQTKILCAALLTLAVAAAPFAAEARPFGAGAGYHDGSGPHWGQMQQLAPEKAEQMRALRLEHQKAVQPLRDQLWAKQALLDALSGNPKVDPKELRELVAEIADLRSKLNATRLEFTAKVKSETGFDMPYAGGKGYGKHGGGYYGGPGYGKHGGHYGGRGRGCGW